VIPIELVTVALTGSINRSCNALTSILKKTAKEYYSIITGCYGKKRKITTYRACQQIMAFFLIRITMTDLIQNFLSLSQAFREPRGKRSSSIASS
jgi:hypothetical protein